MFFVATGGILRTNIVLKILIMAIRIDRGPQRCCVCRRTQNVL